MLAVCGGTDRVHLTEIAAAMAIPVKPLGAPTAVAGYIQAGKWSLVKSVAESDVLATSFVLLRYLSLTNGASMFGAADRPAVFASKQVHRPYAPIFAAYRLSLLADALSEARAMHSLLAA
jgi:hypothetical protein